MSHRGQAPPALEHHLRLGLTLHSLILLTSTLACSVNWLSALFVGNALPNSSGQKVLTDGVGESELGASSNVVVFVSWMRDLTFWKSEIRRATGLDVSKAIQKNHLAFVDCLNHHSSSSKATVEAERTILVEIRKFQELNPDRHILLVLDNPDVLLATAGTTRQELSRLMLALRSLVHSTVLTLYADLPVISAAVSSFETPHTPIEIETAAFIAAQAHASCLVLSARELETGAAKDISGVLRISRGGNSYDLDGNAYEGIEDGEKLYFVQRDGIAKVFDRGTDSA